MALRYRDAEMIKALLFELEKTAHGSIELGAFNQALSRPQLFLGVTPWMSYPPCHNPAHQRRDADRRHSWFNQHLSRWSANQMFVRL